MTDLLDIDLTQLNMDELTELRDKCNAQMSRLRNTGKSFERAPQHRRRNYKFTDRDLANSFYKRWKEYVEWTEICKDGYYMITLWSTVYVHRDIEKEYILKPETRKHKDFKTGKVKNMRTGDTYICSGEKEDK